MRSGSRLAVFAAIALLSAAGCSTVIKTSSPEDVAGAAERDVLRAAAADVAWAPWPKPSSSSLAERLAGSADAGEKVSRDDAVDAYVATLQRASSAETAILADADRHLGAARALTSATDEARNLPSARLSDVALIEAAIADLRETRAIYKASFKKIDADDDVGDRVTSDLDEAIKDLGKAADSLAKSAMKRREEALAKSTPVATSSSF